MNRFSNAADQEDACLNGKFTGSTDGESTCKWTACANVGYCVDTRDIEYFDEMSAWEADAKEQRSLLSIDNEELHADSNHGWGNGRPVPTPRPTNPPKTPRPTTWTPPKTPRPTKNVTPRPTKGPKTPRPTVWNPPKTPRPTKGEKTPKPTKNKTPKPTRGEKTPKPTKNKTPKPTKIKTPRPTKDTTPRPTKDKTP